MGRKFHFFGSRPVVSTSCPQTTSPTVPFTFVVEAVVPVEFAKKPLLSVRSTQVQYRPNPPRHLRKIQHFLRRQRPPQDIALAVG